MCNLQSKQIQCIIARRYSGGIVSTGCRCIKGDWTKPSDKITQFLKQRGQVAVPFNQIYGPCHKDGVVLPPLLNKDSTLTILSEAKGAQ